MALLKKLLSRRRCYRLLIILISFVFVYLCIQLILFIRVSDKQLAGLNDRDHFKDQTLYEKINLRIFIDICNYFKVKTSLIDPTILNNIVHGNQSRWQHCRFICTGETVTTVTVLETRLERKMITNLTLQGFSSIRPTVKSSDPQRFSLNPNAAPPAEIITHYLFTRYSHTIHVVILYSRSNLFLWYSAVTDQDLRRSSLTTQQLKLGKYAGAINSFDRVSVSLDGLRLFVPRYPQYLLDNLRNSRFIECNYTRARQFYKRYPRDESQQAKQFRREASKLIHRGYEYLNQIEVAFWLSSGTCLGWFRQCDIIAHSKDVDFGIWIKNYKESLILLFEGNSLPLTHKFGKVSDSFELSFRENDVKLDIFFFYEEGGYMWNGGTQARTGKKFKYIFPNFTMCWTLFLNMKLRIPCETEAYIEANYGRDWFIPVTQWDWKNSPPNVRENGEWSREEWNDVIQIYPAQ
ncbi:ribitol-5-phosphate transferase FKTN-like [Tubulanus polymorphus]|uniref:ribitol-5-phosphate transferase FKTN-like n=1 Tax=Tubulanus polymorphus TaxID=672921 RepID=UPI003DA39095